MKIPKFSKRSRSVAIVAALIVVGLVLIISPRSVTLRLQQAAKRRWLILSGKLVDVGGFRLRIDCQGTGSPTVVMESGLDRTRKTWGPELPGKIAEFTRVCTYDRAGLGESDLPLSSPRTGRQSVDELNLLLHKSGESGPFLLVGHSLGGAHARLFASLYPREVAGLVLIDSAYEDQYDDYIKLKSPDELGKYLNHLRGANREHLDILESADEIRHSPKLPAVPTIVLSSDRNFASPDEPERQLHDRTQAALTGLIPESKLVVVEKSGHFIYQDNPAAVVNSVHDIYETVKKPAVVDLQSIITAFGLFVSFLSAFFVVTEKTRKRREKHSARNQAEA